MIARPPLTKDTCFPVVPTNNPVVATSNAVGPEDFILCVTEKKMESAEAGLVLARRVREATDAQLHHIVFWTHTSDARRPDREMAYRLVFMDDLVHYMM